MRAEYGKSAYLHNIAEREQQREDARQESNTQARWYEADARNFAQEHFNRERQDLRKRMEC